MIRGSMKSGTINEWKIINNKSQLVEIENESYSNPVVIFKNSSRCGISQSMLLNFQQDMRQANSGSMGFYLLDIVKNRDISSIIAQQFNLHHESPQLLVIENGECTYHKNHWNISYSDLIKYIKDTKANIN
jgi:bacillithiol system protein YtxJ